ncbi:DUF1963 domain-containing protein [Novosphingobium resinovorum]|uniref:DUF1963 domain-containing protein n=1 Tax=Novosphingobium resinovorum TaxID=158500 RepID=A0A1D8A8D8_9SPHN|nr:DUF1963 domain-containing protein [Novosphingobium resinovorum]AOR78384.1 hypothetical protein BES08_17710 [Novosphingobium resinovorum]
MKKLIAALAAFALPALLAAWLALAPLGGQYASLDPLAERVIGMQGRNAAVFALLMAGIGLAVLAALAVRGKPAERLTYQPQVAPQQFGRRRRKLTAEPEPVDEESPEEDALPFEEPATEEPADEPEAPALPPQPTVASAPVVLVRKQRERRRDWFGDASWLGGLPRLGNAEWPRDEAGTPLPFAAQIDLSELAAARPDMPLPRSGSLAFFLGAGAVVAVPEGIHDFTDPPTDLPPAYDEGGLPFPTRHTRLTRWFFPFWPVSPVALDPTGPQSDAALAVRLGAALRDHTFYAAGVGAPVEALWWHAVIHLSDRLHEALDEAPRLLSRRRDEMARQNAEIARLRTDAAAIPYALEDAQEIAEQIEGEYALLQDQCAALPAMVAALDQFIAGREPMKRLTAEELAVVGDILAELHERYGEVVQAHLPGTLADLATISLRTMVSGPPETLAAVPDAVLSRINREYRMPPVHHHRMLDAETDGSEVLLLQLGYDDLMEWAWEETGAWRFRIGAQALLTRDWQAATLAFETD